MDESHKQKWTYMMGLTYMIVNIADFVAFPIMFTIVQFWETQAANDAFRQWIPLTLTNGGFIHIAFGAILSVSAYSKEEKKPDVQPA